MNSVTSMQGVAGQRAHSNAMPRLFSRPLRNCPLVLCFDASVLYLVDMRQLETVQLNSLVQFREKAMGKHALISFLAEILKLWLACACLY